MALIVTSDFPSWRFQDSAGAGAGAAGPGGPKSFGPRYKTQAEVDVAIE